MSKRTKENNKKQRRIGEIEEVENRYYIFSEGSNTEPLYFGGFKKSIESNAVYRHTVQLIPIGTGRETINVVREAEKYIKQHKITKGEVWCLYDKDDFPADQFDAASRYVDELNASNTNPELSYHAAWSNECVEYWFVLHFSYYTANNHRKQYEEYLDKVFREHGKEKYKKTDPLIWETLLEIGNPQNALRYADRQLQEFAGQRDSDSAPATKVHHLVRKLIPYLPEAAKSHFE